MKTLDLGCGSDKLHGAVGMDVNPGGAADIVHDMDVTPWPLESDAFDYIRAQDVLEHVERFIPVMEEIYRVGRDGARVEIRMPFMTSLQYATDPTHRRAATSRTFDYFDPSKDLSKYMYTKARFEVVSVRYERGYLSNNMVSRWIEKVDRRIMWLLHAYPEIYELYFAGIYPVHNVSYALRVRKDRA